MREQDLPLSRCMHNNIHLSQKEIGRGTDIKYEDGLPASPSGVMVPSLTLTG
jgi:hypothetical protein